MKGDSGREENKDKNKAYHDEEMKNDAPKRFLVYLKKVSHPGARRVPESDCGHKENDGEKNSDHETTQENITPKDN
jgi:hypothetical protein